MPETSLKKVTIAKRRFELRSDRVERMMRLVCRSLELEPDIVRHRPPRDPRWALGVPVSVSRVLARPRARPRSSRIRAALPARREPPSSDALKRRAGLLVAAPTPVSRLVSRHTSVPQQSAPEDP